MKKTTKTIIYSLAALTGIIAISGGISLADVDAATNGTNSQNKFHNRVSIIDEVAKKFNINKSELEKTIEEFGGLMGRGQRKANNKERGLDSRLDKMVENGQITKDQEKELIEKRNSLRSQIANTNLSLEEKENLREQHQKEMQEMAQKYGIKLGDGMGLHKRFGQKIEK